jgi:hydrogenase expression/formation protein HypD
MEAILDDEFSSIQGFLAAGHVCTVMGTDEYLPLIDKYKIPIVVTGFEPVDLLQGILTTVDLLEAGTPKLVNEYARVVKPAGNPQAQVAIAKVFEVGEREWRGIGPIPESGYVIRREFERFDADHRFSLPKTDVIESPLCIAGEILKGNKKPFECKAFGKECTPQSPLGAPMVSSEGACAAYYHYAQIET